MVALLIPLETTALQVAIGYLTIHRLSSYALLFLHHGIIQACSSLSLFSL